MLAELSSPDSKIHWLCKNGLMTIGLVDKLTCVCWQEHVKGRGSWWIKPWLDASLYEESSRIQKQIIISLNEMQSETSRCLNVYRCSIFQKNACLHQVKFRNIENKYDSEIHHSSMKLSANQLMFHSFFLIKTDFLILFMIKHHDPSWVSEVL